MTSVSVYASFIGLKYDSLYVRMGCFFRCPSLIAIHLYVAQGRRSLWSIQMGMRTHMRSSGAELDRLLLQEKCHGW